ncbi:MAG: histidine kinase, partial [Acidobacteriota bacterium]
MPATGLSRGLPSATGDPRLAFEAVQSALDRLGATRARSVLLFLTGHFARNPGPAIHAAARAAQTTQISGCTAVGVYTEKNWVIDAPAAAAMVFGESADERDPAPALHAQPDDWLLSFAAPNSVNGDWLSMPGRRIGA